jgi:phasin family protein
MALDKILQPGKMGKEGVEALMQQGADAVKGLEALAGAYIQLGNQLMERATTTMQTLAAVRNPAEFPGVYAEVTRANIEFLVGESRKIFEMVVSTTTAGAVKNLGPLAAPFQTLTGMLKLPF